MKKLIAVENHLAKGRESLYRWVSAARMEERQSLGSGRLRAQHRCQQLPSSRQLPPQGSTHPQCPGAICSWHYSWVWEGSPSCLWSPWITCEQFTVESAKSMWCIYSIDFTSCMAGYLSHLILFCYRQGVSKVAVSQNLTFYRFRSF